MTFDIPTPQTPEERERIRRYHDRYRCAHDIVCMLMPPGPAAAHMAEFVEKRIQVLDPEHLWSKP